MFTSGAGMSTVNTQVVKTGSQAYADDPDGDGEWNLDSQTITGTLGAALVGALLVADEVLTGFGRSLRPEARYWYGSVRSIIRLLW